MKIEKVYPPPAPPTTATPPPPVCEVVAQPDGSVIITLCVESQVMKRHRLRAGSMDINRYMWENVLHRALVDSVY